MRSSERFRVKAIIGILLSGAVFMLALPDDASAAGTKNIILATTTSTQDSGLLDELLPVFQEQTGFFVKTIAVGSGQAMAMAPVGTGDIIVACQSCTNTGGDGFFAPVRMEVSPYGSLPVQLYAFLFELPDRIHGPVQTRQLFLLHILFHDLNQNLKLQL